MASMSLPLYAVPFFYAYIRLDVGVGALIFFGAVEITVVAWNAWMKKVPSSWELLGIRVALSGLGLLTLPGKTSPNLFGVFLMTSAGIGWAVYTLKGRTSTDPLGATTMNFFRTAALSLMLLIPIYSRDTSIMVTGVGLALISGVITSGLGYAFWYAAISELGNVRVGIVQLAVPVIALFGSSAFLGERLSTRIIASVALILGGILITLRLPNRIAR